MARIERYFPVAQDINGDPETWVFTDQFGDRALRLWLEILSITDRLENRWRLVDGWLVSISRKVRQSSATVSREVDWLLAKQWLIVHESSADGSPLVVGTRNYEKFHRPRNIERNRDGRYVGTVPSEPTEPNLPNQTNKKRDALRAVGRGEVSDLKFEAFYKAYPRHVGKKSALAAWKKEAALIAGLAEKIMDALARHKTQEQWVKDNGQFIPHPATWLNQRRWDDEVIQPKSQFEGMEMGPDGFPLSPWEKVQMRKSGK